MGDFFKLAFTFKQEVKINCLFDYGANSMFHLNVSTYCMYTYFLVGAKKKKVISSTIYLCPEKWQQKSEYVIWWECLLHMKPSKLPKGVRGFEPLKLPKGARGFEPLKLPKGARGFETLKTPQRGERTPQNSPKG